MNASWTDEDVAMLKRLWKEGRSATEIAKQIGRKSRNAIIGKVHRLEAQESIGGRTVKAKPERTQRQPAKPKIAKVALMPPAPKHVLPPVHLVDDSIVKPRPLLMKLFDLGNNDCRWPVEGEKAATLFCGHNTHLGSSWCAYHYRMAFVPREVRADRRAA